MICPHCGKKTTFRETNDEGIWFTCVLCYWTLSYGEMEALQDGEQVG